MYEIIGDQLYHDKKHFIQGLTYSRSSDTLFESVGEYGKSMICKLNPTTGATIKCNDMERKYFAEGMQVYGEAGEEKLIQLTWKSKTGFIYDADTLDLIRTFQFKTTKNQGWGICFDESKNEFIVSDGSAYLHFWDAETLEEKHKLQVVRQGKGVPAIHLNELEFMNGKILSNVWYEDVLLVIDPETGRCEMEYDFSSLWPKTERTGDVLNGISVSSEDNVIYVTGKLWDRMFKVTLNYFSSEYYYSIPANFDDVNVLEIVSETGSKKGDDNGNIEDEYGSEVGEGDFLSQEKEATIIGDSHNKIQSGHDDDREREREHNDFHNVDDDNGKMIGGGDNDVDYDSIEDTSADNTEYYKNVTLEDGKMYEIIGDQLYHDKKHFIQGLTYSRSSDTLFESVGEYGKSMICKLNPTTGATIKCNDMERKYFAEGMQVYGEAGEEKLIQLTWKSKTGFIYDADTLDLIRTFQFKTTKNQGWGICFDESKNEFIVSDGSAYLHFWDAETLEEKHKLQVVRQGKGVPAIHLNELEFMNGKILSNVWYEDVLLVIDPETGRCEMEYDFSSLWPKTERTGDVLNGISVSSEDNVIYVTGKLWDRMFKVTLNYF